MTRDARRTVPLEGSLKIDTTGSWEFRSGQWVRTSRTRHDRARLLRSEAEPSRNPIRRNPLLWAIAAAIAISQIAAILTL